MIEKDPFSYVALIATRPKGTIKSRWDYIPITLSELL